MAEPNPFQALPLVPVHEEGLALASPWERLAARLIDEAVFWVLPGLGLVVAAWRPDERLAMLAGAVLFAVFLVYVATQLWLLSMGQSFGKRAMGLTMVDAQGRPHGIVRTLVVREMVRWGILVFPYLGAPAALIDTLLVFSESRQTVHDRVAGTWVVTSRPGGVRLRNAGGKGLPVALVLAFFLLPLALMVAGFLAFFLLRPSTSGLDRERRDAIGDVDELLRAELAYREKTGAWAAAGSEAEARAWAPGAEARPWPGGDGWSVLDWAPPVQVQCATWVEVLGDDMRVRSLCDLDGDGRHALIEATPDEPAHLLSEDRVY